MWNYLRDGEGWPIISTWHRPENVLPNTDMTAMWFRIQQEVAMCTDLILYAEPNDLPLKGAFVEVGMALILLKRVFVVYRGPSALLRQHLGSWILHPNVVVCDDLQTVFHAITGN